MVSLVGDVRKQLPHRAAIVLPRLVTVVTKDRDAVVSRAQASKKVIPTLLVGEPRHRITVEVAGVESTCLAAPQHDRARNTRKTPGSSRS